MKNSITTTDDNIAVLRGKYPTGLHFVVGDTHGETETLKALMNNIQFDPDKDHVFFVGDYNAGGNPARLLQYLANYYQEDCGLPGFHLIRGNHERELGPLFPLENLPDVMVLRGRQMNYYLVHAGMVTKALRLINDDMAKSPQESVFSYRLADCCTEYDAPLRQLIWSRRGLYSQRSRWHNWPSLSELTQHKACILHGHTPYCYFMNNYFTYGDCCLFWPQQHIWFSEDLQSFNLDSNVKGRYENGESYRGLTCVCLEVLEEVSQQNGGMLTITGIQNGPNGVFGEPYHYSWQDVEQGDLHRITNAEPEMKTITLDEEGSPIIVEKAQ